MPTTVTISPASFELTAVGDTVRLTAEVRDQNQQVMTSAGVNWASGDSAVVTVDSLGLVRAAGRGSTRVSASAGSARDSAAATVWAVAAVTLSPANLNLGVGETGRLVAEVTDVNGDPAPGAPLAWTSGNEAVARVDSAGVVTGIAAGETQITVTSGPAAAQSAVVVTSQDSDREALVALYEATDGPNWRNNTNWITDKPLDEWHGVQLNEHGRVHAVNLWDARLRGPLPPEIGDLAHLSELILFGNSLTGEIPPEIGKLSRLNRLYISYRSFNELEGPIPPEIGNLVNLTHLSLVADGLTGPIPPEVGNLSSLFQLTLSGNGLAGPIPPGIGDLSELRELSLSGAGLIGPLPGTFLALDHLRKLGTTLCIPGPPDWFAWAASIENVGASFCNDADRVVLDAFREATGGPAWTHSEGWQQESLGERHGVTVDSLGYVTGLDLSENGLSGRLPTQLGQLAHLVELRLGGNDLSGPLPLSLTTTSLTTFHYADTGLCAPADAAFGAWLASISILEGTGDECELSERDLLAALFTSAGGPGWTRNDSWLTDVPLGEWHGVGTDDEGRVRSLDLNGGGLAGPVPAELWKLTHLGRLDLRRNQLTGSIPAEIGEIRGLDSLWLSDNHLSGSIPPEIGDLPELRILDLRNNRLHGSIPPELGRLRNLVLLMLGENDLSGEIPIDLGDVASLRDVTLSANRLSGPIPGELGNLTSLKYLRLNANQLSGPIPPELGELPELWRMNLGRNQLTGPIPAELGNLANLRELSFWRNELTGSIPRWLGSLSELEILWLAENRLTGEIPPELGSLVNLRDLVIYGNPLTGPLPPELGNLTRLSTLSIGGTGLSGAIPEEFVNLRLRRFLWTNTRLCSPVSGEFQAWLSSLHVNQGGGPCVLEAFAALHDSAGGSSWTNDDNWLSDEPLGDWYGVAVDEQGRPIGLDLRDNGLAGTIPGALGKLGALQRLDLGENDLTGAIPPELGELIQLEALDLGSNQLTDAIPARFGELVELRRLDVGHNRLTGELPSELGHLRRLEELDVSHNDLGGALLGSLARLSSLVDFRWNATGLCAPEPAWFRAWLGSIASQTPGEDCAAAPFLWTVPATHLTQAAQNLEGDVPLIAGRSALLRVFPTVERANAYQPRAQATFFTNGTEVHRAWMAIGSEQGVPTAVDPGEPGISFNAVIPGEIIKPGVEVVIDIDPDSIVPRAAGSSIRVPATGRLALDVRELSRLDLTVIPVLNSVSPDSSVLDWARSMDADVGIGGFTRHILPVGDLGLAVREPYTTDLDPRTLGEWRELLREIELLRISDAVSGHYYGVMEPGMRSGIRGVGYLPGAAAVGLPDPLVLAHELGHNLSLQHTPCGIAFDDDPNYPYRSGEIGVWGYDALGDSLIAPSIPDVMGSGCEPAWISDYHFRKALEYRAAAADTHAQAVEPGREPRLLLWGGVDADGELQLDPAVVLDAPSVLPSRGGPYRLEGFGPGGGPLFSLSFAVDEVDHGGGNFLFIIPFEDGWRGALQRIVLSGPQGATTLDGETNRPMAIFMDHATGRVRSIRRGEEALQAATVAGDAGAGFATDPDIEVLLSRGLPEIPPN